MNIRATLEPGGRSGLQPAYKQLLKEWALGLGLFCPAEQRPRAKAQIRSMPLNRGLKAHGSHPIYVFDNLRSANKPPTAAAIIRHTSSPVHCRFIASCGTLAFHPR